MRWLHYCVIGFVLCAAGCKAQGTRLPTYNERIQMTVLWSQTAGEAQALRFQAYNVAHFSLDRALAEKTTKKPPAIVADLDETALDISAYEAQLVLDNVPHSHELWRAWTAADHDRLYPGALEFLRYADSHGVAIYYITNRKEDQKKDTLRNMVRLGVPQSTVDHLLCRNTTSNKEGRRMAVAQTHDILLLLGDNLGDFSELFDDKNIPDRMAAVHTHQSAFGAQWIVFPNPMYGGWKSALYDNNWQLPNEEKYRIERATLRR